MNDFLIKLVYSECKTIFQRQNFIEAKSPRVQLTHGLLVSLKKNLTAQLKYSFILPKKLFSLPVGLG